MKTFYVYLTAAVLFLTAGCSNNEDKTELYILAAASLSDVMSEIAESYNNYSEDTELIFNFSSSGRLRQQIMQGSPADIFLSASVEEMDRLEEEGAVLSRVNLLQNRLVLIASEDHDFQYSSVNDLAGPETDSLAIGQPELVPVGRYAEEALRNAGVLDEIEEKIVYTNDTRQALTYAETGNVDTAVVYETDAGVSESVKVFDIIDESTYSPVYYPAGLLSGANSPAEAEEFLEWLQSEEAGSIFEANGFTIFR
ncbi:molybdate ABC transporter substrate-binding protein [Evansella clarkii]|uniref:molybdate ABC transporter substrate-binding protein n=1 Tax=Evansella clarkii TaxID=79879 RepID=UPI00099617C6|nr:molybdate ABC transporter substrate-binding protein [Evansella clarkii]